MKKLLVAALFAAVAVAGAAEYLIKAAAVSEKGAWTTGINTKVPGGQILFSHKKGVENTAKGTYAMPEAGQYYVWVRTMNFGEKYRKTEVKFNGKSVGKFGDEGVKGEKKWGWKRSLAFIDLPEGELKLELIPLSNVSRVADIILTTNKDYSPVDKDRDALEEIPELECE